MSTRRGVLVAGGAWLAGIAAAADGSRELPRAVSLRREIASAQAAGKALVAMVSLEGCPWCRMVREGWLLPLHEAGQPVVQVEMARELPLEDAQGRPTSHGALVKALGVRVAPTVLFLSPNGREAAPRIAGVPLPDFYGAYLQERLDLANRQASTSRVNP